MTFSEQSPQVNVALEVLEQWADWVGPNWKSQFTSPVFSADERYAIDQFDRVWYLCRSRLPQPLPELAQLQLLEDWQYLRVGAEMLLCLMQKRGVGVMVFS